MNELTKTVLTNDGREAVIEISDDGEVIWVKTPDGKEIGHAELSTVDYDGGMHYRLTWMYLNRLHPSYTQQGLGRAALLFHKESFHAAIEVADDDGDQRSDGGHLTGDAPGFVAKMIREGILFRESEQYNVSDDDSHLGIHDEE